MHVKGSLFNKDHQILEYADVYIKNKKTPAARMGLQIHKEKPKYM